MTKRGRQASTIQLTTGNDPTLWQYASVDEALRKNADFIAKLIDPSLLSANYSNIPVSTGENVPKRRKARKW